MDTMQYDPHKKVITSKPLDHVISSTNGLGYEIFEAMKKFKDSKAQIDAQTGQTDTYQDVQKRCIRTALKMKSLGIKPGDIITICSYNHLNSTIPYISALFIGAISANLDPTLSLTDIQHLLNIVKPKLIFATSNAIEKLQKAIKAIEHQCEIICFSDGSFSDFICNQPGEENFQPIICDDGNSTCNIFFSSGTTGMPKGICVSHNYLKLCGATICPENEIQVTLAYSSMYWISNIMTLFGTILDGRCRLLCESFNPELFWGYATKYKVNFIFLAPSQIITALKRKPANWRSDSLRLVIGGSRIAPTYLKELGRCLQYQYGFGLTECGIVSRLDCRDIKVGEKLESAGRIEPGVQIKIVDPDTEQPVGFNTSGELRVKPIYSMNGYYKQLCNDSWDSDGFIKTGDLAHYDEHFYLFIEDRIKEMFKYLSWHIVPATLEKILEKHPAVQFGIVLGIPHPEEDNHAMGVVVLNKNMQATEKELMDFVDSQVDERSRLRAGVRIIDAMPLTPSGKIKRVELRNRMVQEMSC